MVNSCNWEELDLSECVNVFQGGTPSTKNPAYWGDEIVWVTPTDVTALSGRILLTSERKITKEGLEKSSAVLLPIGTILLCSRATIGASAIAGVPLATNQGFKNLVTKDNCDPIFLYYLLKTKIGEMLSKASGSTFLEISKSNLLSIAIDLPPIEEQKAIAKVLSELDDLIEKLDCQIEKKQSIRDGMLEDLVSGKRRLPGFDGEWEKHDFMSLINPKARIGWQGLKKSEYLKAGYSLLIAGTDFYDGMLKYESMSYVSKERYDMDANIQIENNDVLVTKDGTIGKVAIVKNLTMPATLSSGVFIFKVINKKLTQDFLYYILRSSIFERFIENLSAGSTIKHLYQKDLKNLSFNIPKMIEEQNAITAFIQNLDSEVSLIKQKRAKYSKLKQGLMEELLTGNIRLNAGEVR
jgi:type I restriction enzyme S subunit